MVEPAVVVQKIVIGGSFVSTWLCDEKAHVIRICLSDAGGLQPSYLGPPESIFVS